MKGVVRFLIIKESLFMLQPKYTCQASVQCASQGDRHAKISYQYVAMWLCRKIIS